jgi:hypothetical protein
MTFLNCEQKFVCHAEIPRLQRYYDWLHFPGAMPQAFAFRAFDAESRSTNRSI